jgi:hypothetical protein
MIVHCPACNTAHEVAWAAPNQSQDNESTRFQCFGCGEKQLETPDIPERVGLRIDLVTGPVQPDEPISFAQESRRLHNFVLQRAEVIVWWVIIAACTVGFVYLWSIKAHVVGKQILWMSRFGIPLSIVAIFHAKSAAANGDEDQTRQMRWILLMLASWASPAAIEYVHRFSCPGIHT